MHHDRRCNGAGEARSSELELATLLLVGFIVGLFGTLVGAGGGFLMLPFLLTAMHFAPAEAAGTTQLFVLANAVSGAIPYYLQGRVHMRIALVFSAFAIPGSIVGASFSAHVPGRLFEQLFAVLLVGIAARTIYLQFFTPLAAAVADLMDHEPDMRVLGVLATAIGTLAGLFGIGGGPVQVPVLLNVFRLPVHAATATSVFILAITGVFATGVHAAYGHVLIGPAIAASIGGVIGAQVGVPLSRVFKSKALVVMFAIAIVGTAGRLLIPS